MWHTALSIAGRLLLGFMIAAIGGDEEESVMAVIGGGVIAASAFPTWYRAKIDRLRANGGNTALFAQLEARMTALEERQQDRLDQIEQARSGQFADLEERVDFAERLLAKRGQSGPG